MRKDYHFKLSVGCGEILSMSQKEHQVIKKFLNAIHNLGNEIESEAALVLEVYLEANTILCHGEKD